MDKLQTNFNYGILPKNAMKDRDLTIQAKAIYAYLCSYGGSKGEAFPKVSLITYELKISKDTFYKHMKVLKETGYVETKQRKDSNGKFKHTVYTLNPYPKKPYTENQCTKNTDLVNKDTKINKGFKINNSKTNSFKDDDTNNQSSPTKNDLDLDKIKKMFNEKSPTKIRSITSKRLSGLGKLFIKFNINDFEEALSKIHESDYLSERLEFDWFIDIDNFTMVLEGKYKTIKKSNKKSKKNISNFKQRTDEMDREEIMDKINNKNKNPLALGKQEDECSDEASEIIARITKCS